MESPIAPPGAPAKAPTPPSPSPPNASQVFAPDRWTPGAVRKRWWPFLDKPTGREKGRAFWLWLKGPKLQFLNLSILFTTVNLTLDYPNSFLQVFVCVGLGALLDGLISWKRWGEARIPWPTMVATLGVSLMLDFWGYTAPLLLPLIMVASKHLIRYKGRHLFNPNNFAAAMLLSAPFFVALWNAVPAALRSLSWGGGFPFVHVDPNVPFVLGNPIVRIGIIDWGAAPQMFVLMIVFGSISTFFVKRIDLAFIYLALAWLVYGIIGFVKGYGLASVWMFAFNPVQVLIAFFAITDPATSPGDGWFGWEKVLWAFMIVLVGVPAVLDHRVEGPVYALLIVAPQRILVKFLVERFRPAAGPKGAVGASAVGAVAAGSKGVR